MEFTKKNFNEIKIIHFQSNQSKTVIVEKLEKIL